MVKKVLLAALLLTALMTGIASAQEKLEPVPEIDFLTWVPAKFMAYFETSNYIAEEWRKLGLKVNLNQANMPNPLLTLWFKEHKFDCVVSVLSGLPYRMEPDFFTYSQFNSKNTAPGDWNVGEWSNAESDGSPTSKPGILSPPCSRMTLKCCGWSTTSWCRSGPRARPRCGRPRKWKLSTR